MRWGGESLSFGDNIVGRDILMKKYNKIINLGVVVVLNKWLPPPVSLVFVVCVVFGRIRCTTLFSCYCLRTTLSFSSLLLFVIAIILRTTLSFVIATPSLLLFVVFSSYSIRRICCSCIRRIRRTILCSCYYLHTTPSFSNCYYSHHRVRTPPGKVLRALIGPLEPVGIITLTDGDTVLIMK